MNNNNNNNKETAVIISTSRSSVPPELLPPPDDEFNYDIKPLNQIRIYVCATFDAFHWGHINFLRKAHDVAKEEKLGGNVFLIVGLCSDESCTIGKRPPIFSWEERAASVYQSRFVNHVFKADYVTPWEQIERMKIDIIVTGNDYTIEGVRKYFPGSEHLWRPVGYTEGVSTTELCRRFQEREEIESKPIEGCVSAKIATQHRMLDKL